MLAQMKGRCLRQTTMAGRRFLSGAKPQGRPQGKQQQQQGRQGGQQRRRPDQRNKFQQARPARLYRDPETGFTEGGRLNLCFKPEQMPNSGLVPLEMREEIYNLHTTDPTGKGELKRMAYLTGLSVKRLQGIIKLVGHEKAIEAETGEAIDRTFDLEARKIFGEKKDWRDEKGTGEEEKAETALKMSGRWRWILDGEEYIPPEAKIKGQYESMTGFYTPWAEAPKYGGETVAKVDQKSKLIFLVPGSGSSKNKQGDSTKKP